MKTLKIENIQKGSRIQDINTKNIGVVISITKKHITTQMSTTTLTQPIEYWEEADVLYDEYDARCIRILWFFIGLFTSIGGQLLLKEYYGHI